MRAQDQREQLVLSGLSGRLPESDSIEEFAQQLFDGVDLVTADGRRWEPGLYGLPERNGKLKDLSRFDASFFGVHGKQAHRMDPQMRILLELTHEAIVDAGYNPAELRGSRTGVYVGVSSSDSEEMWTANPDTVNGYEITGCLRAMFANRISYTFDFKGPSFALDSACCSSMTALVQAVDAIRAGRCDSAIVAGTSLCLKPTMSLCLQRQNLLSPEGKCAPFDASASGYVRSEAVVVVLLQRRSAARRVYATVRAARMNMDGAKEQGYSYPNGDEQRRLTEETFKEAGVCSEDVTYFEAHGPGTKVGDPEEVNAIATIFCKNRQKPLLLGSVKSNMGHSEAASGLCSVAKVIVAMERGELPANLHYTAPNSEIPALIDGRIQVVARNTKWDGGLATINSFGFGGANANVLLESEQMKIRTPAQYVVPRLVVASGRTDEAVRALLGLATRHPTDAELHALLDAVHARSIPGHLHRGYTVLNTAGPPTEEIFGYNGEARPIWFIFSGMGSQWSGMARALMALPVFAQSVERSAAALRPYNIDLTELLTKAPDAAFDDVINSFISITAVQVALVDVLKELGIHPDGIIGHSVGEIGCAYADETLTNEQAVLCAYWRGRSVVDAKLEPGAMAAIGLSWEQCENRLPPEVMPACHNAVDNVTVSGPVTAVEKLVADLRAQGVFARRVNSSGVASHSKYIAAAAPLLLESLERVIPEPRPRSARWVSSSLPRERWAEDIAKLSDAAYHVNNLLSPVRFIEALRHIPERALVVELAPHALLQAVLRRALPHAALVSLVHRDGPDTLRHLLAAVGKIYAHGAQPIVARLYPPVTWPVSRGTPGLASHVRWDHSTEWSVANFGGPASSAKNIIEYDLSKPEDAFIIGHNVDGRILFPVAGYLTMVWRTVAKLAGRNMEQTAVVLENVRLHRTVIVLRETSLRFLISILDGSGQFEVCHEGTVVVSGFVRVTEDAARERLELLANERTHEPDQPQLLTNDIYKELRLRGYNYGGTFRGIRESDLRISVGKLAWEDNWITFLDTILQYKIISENDRGLYLPARLQRVLIDPVAQTAALKEKGAGTSLPVHIVREMDVVASGGVEFRGLKLAREPRRPNTQAAPKLEKYVFVPYDNLNFGIEDTSRSMRGALITSLETVVENAGTLRLKVVEAALERAQEALLLPVVLPLLASEPKLRIDAVLAAGAQSIDYSAALQHLEIKVTKSDPRTSSSESECHTILAADVLARHGESVLARLAAWLAETGMLLLREPLYVLDHTATIDMLGDVGFAVVSRQVTTSCEYLLLKRRAQLPERQLVIEIDESLQYEWVNKLKEALQRSADGEELRVYAVARGRDSGVLGLAGCLRGEPGGHALRVYYAPDIKEAFHTERGVFKTQTRLDLTVNVMRAGVWGSYRHLPVGDTAGVQLLVEHAFVNTLIRGDLSSLRWIESDLRWADEVPQPAGTEFCRVYYAALNFHDIMLATGELSPDELPQLANRECILGLEFSGRSESGERVMGMMAAGGLATSVLANTTFLWPVPHLWTLEQAATVPVAYATAYYALCVRGQLQNSESVLIHGGAGGVGQAAITIALQAGCTVFTTVDSTEKRAFLRQRFPSLEDANIGNSSDTSFEQLVLRRTGGRGVNLVLNSLTGNKLLASVRCLAPGGRFLQIGKIGISDDTLLGMATFLKNTTFHGIQLNALFDTENDNIEKTAVVRYINEGIANGTVQPLSSTVFSNHQLEQAFRYMSTGKHIDKVLLCVREEETDGAREVKPHLVAAVPRTYMHPARTYILVGGLGGFGLELTQWLVERGARKFVLASRHGVRSGYQAWCVRRWSQRGVQVLVSRADVTTTEGARELLHKAAALSPVAGLFNLAALLKDAFLENLTPNDFSKVAAPKLDATRALDAATRELAPELEYFVVFSSVTSGRGIPGQSNYGFANSCMERIMEQRQADGLPGLAVQWGAIGDVGLIIDTLGGNEDTVVGGTVPQSIGSCFEALSTLMSLPYAVGVSMVLADKTKKTKAQKGSQEFDLVRQIANILGIKDASSVAQTASLAELGIDSLMSEEIKQTLENGHDLVLSMNQIRTLTFARLHQITSGAE